MTNFLYDQILFCIFTTLFFAFSYEKAMINFKDLFRKKKEHHHHHHHHQNRQNHVSAPREEVEEEKNDSVVENEEVTIEEVDVVSESSESTVSTESTRRKKKKQKKADILDAIKFGIHFYGSYNSTMVFIGLTTETYLFGAKMYCNLFAMLIAYCVVGFILQPFFYDLDESIKTPYEYLEKRYNSKFIRILCGVVGALFYLSFYSLFLCSVGLTISTLFPNLNQMWLPNILFGIFSIFGTFLGGLTQSVKLVIVQFVLFFVGIVSSFVITFHSNDRHTSQELWDIAYKYGRRDLFDTTVDLTTRYTLLSQLISLPIPWCTMHSILPHMFQKYRSIKTKLRSRVFLLSNIPITSTIYTIIFLCGIACFVFYYDCDPRFTDDVRNKNQIASLWFIQTLNQDIPSLAGICLSGIVCWGLVTHSNGLLHCADVLINDILGQIKCSKKFLEEKINTTTLRKVLFKNLVLLGFGSLSILYAEGLLYTERTVLALFFLFNNSLNSNILGLFLLSMLNPFANVVGASIGFICGVSINIWIGLSSVVSAKLINQELEPNSFYCQKNLSDTFIAKLQDKSYYPEDPILFQIYSINPIWLCSIGLYTNLIVGTLSSFIYSFIRTRTHDCDSEFKTERKKYLLNLNNLKF